MVRIKWSTFSALVEKRKDDICPFSILAFLQPNNVDKESIILQNQAMPRSFQLQVTHHLQGHRQRLGKPCMKQRFQV